MSAFWGFWGFWEVLTLFRLFWGVHTLACKFSRPRIRLSGGSCGCCSSSYPGTFL